MKLRYLVLVAVGLYATVVGCVMFSGSSAVETSDGKGRQFHSTNVPKGLPYRGVVLQLQAINDLPSYERAVDAIADTGADTIFLILSARQENGTSGEIFMDSRMTPTTEKLQQLIGYCKNDRKLKVGLMPIVLLDHPRGNEWRGKLKPEHWEDWFESYRDMVDSFARVAEVGGVDLFVVGSELTSTEEHVDEWTKTIQSVRSIYHGNITYSANWDHYATIPFWDQLDVIGINCYYSLGENNSVTVEQIKQNWAPIHQKLTDFVVSKGKPLVFLEVGWCSMTNAAKDPWDYTKTSEMATDNDLQRRLYQAFFDTWIGDPCLGGFMIFEWEPNAVSEKGYSPQGKPAGELLKAQFAKKPWVVK